MKPNPFLPRLPLLSGGIAIALGAPQAQAVDFYWDGGTATWTTVSAWSTAADGLTNPTNVPNSTTTADLFFNITSQNTAAATISLAGGDRNARSLTFNTSGATNLRAGGANSTGSLSIGTGGITINSTSGTVTIGQGPVSSYGTLTTVLAASQSWTHNDDSTFTVTGPVTLGANTLTLSGSGSGGVAISGKISGTGSVIHNKSAGTTTLNSANDFSGGFTLNNGAISVSANSYSGFGSGKVTINSTAGSGFVLPTTSAAVISNNMDWLTTLRAQRSGTSGNGQVTFDGAITLKGNSGITVSSSTHAVAAVFNGAIGEDVADRTFTTSGSTVVGNAVTFNGQNTFTGGITNSTNGTVTIGGSGYLGGGNYPATISMGSGTLFHSSSANQTLGGVISGTTAKLTKDTSTTSKLILTAANTYTGATTINAGTLQLGNGGTTGTIQGSSSVVIGTGAEFAINRSNAATQGAASALGNNAPISGAGSVRIMGGTGGTGMVGMNQANTYSGGTILDAGTLRFGANGDSSTFGPIGLGSLTINGGALESSGITRSVATPNAIVVNANFAFNANGDLILPGTVDLTGSTRTLTTNGTAALTLNGVISNGSLTKAGTGTLVLGGANDYNGLTTVSAGTLQLAATGSIASSSGVNLTTSTAKFNVTTANFTLAAAQTLGGVGTVENTGRTFTANGILAPGNSPGTLSVDGGTFALGVGGDYNFQILDAAGAAGTGYDTVNLVNGATLDLSSLTAASYAINLSSLLSIGPDAPGNASNFVNTQSYTWTLFATASSLFSSFNAGDFIINAAGFANALGGGAFSVGLADGDTDLVLNFTPVPEPRAALLGGLGLLMLLRRRR